MEVAGSSYNYTHHPTIEWHNSGDQLHLHRVAKLEDKLCGSRVTNRQLVNLIRGKPMSYNLNLLSDIIFFKYLYGHEFCVCECL
jgi:hypothetical protein